MKYLIFNKRITINDSPCEGAINEEFELLERINSDLLNERGIREWRALGYNHVQHSNLLSRTRKIKLWILQLNYEELIEFIKKGQILMKWDKQYNLPVITLI